MIRTRGLAYRYGAGSPLQFADVDLPQGGTLLLQGAIGRGQIHLAGAGGGASGCHGR